MKNKRAILSILLVFTVLMGGAYVLYNRLGRNVETEQMILHTNQKPATLSSTEEGSADAAEENEPTRENKSESVSAPDFMVYDKEGTEVRLSQYFGKPIVLNFWASWCGPCQSEMPDFNEKYAELGDDIHFLMVNITDGSRETMETALAFIDRHGYEFPVLFDTRSEAALTYGAYSLPTSFFINAQGHVIAQAVGSIDGATLQKGIDMIVN
ncbi:MAG: TlpA family protein disulfide reductase [Clostridiales bacterium]|nr:TlpA family protein disulfide reductase [Clostridiales bacterium]